MKYLCILRYVGTHFHGFQVQPTARTVQGVLTLAAERVFGTSVLVTGCSRTDSGVHAEGFAVTLEPSEGAALIPPENLPLAAREHLPPDLAIISARAVGDGFHPRYDAVEKEYRYTVYAAKVMDPFLYQRAWHMPVPLLPDALRRMNEAASLLVGKQDFSAFRNEGSPTRSPVRQVYECRVEQDGLLYTVIIRGDGFLYNMVRIITGTLFAVGQGKYEPSDILKMLASKKRAASGPTAPADGLSLYRVIYREEDLVRAVRPARAEDGEDGAE